MTRNSTVEWLVVVGLLAAFASPAQQVSIPSRASRKNSAKNQTDPQPTSSLRVDTSLVQVPVTVTDKLGRPVSGLEKENFRIFDNKVEQTIVQFASDDEMVAVGFVFDISGSIGIRMRQYQLAAHEFFKIAEPEDEFFLVTFESSPKLAVPLTRQANEIEYQIMMTGSRGMTALFDAVYLAANEIRKSKLKKKALILISDGGENHSRYTLAELKSALRETDVLLYAIGPSPDSSQGDDDGRLLKNLSEMTGGRLIQISGSDLADLSKKIIVDLRNRYVLYYSPLDKTRDGRYHGIQLQMVPPRGLGKVNAHWRTGYYAPNE